LSCPSLLFVISSMPLDIFPLQGRLRNHRYVFGYSAVENDLVGSNMLTCYRYAYLQSTCFWYFNYIFFQHKYVLGWVRMLYFSNRFCKIRRFRCHD